MAGAYSVAASAGALAAELGVVVGFVGLSLWVRPVAAVDIVLGPVGLGRAFVGAWLASIHIVRAAGGGVAPRLVGREGIDL